MRLENKLKKDASSIFCEIVFQSSRLVSSDYNCIQSGIIEY